MVVPLFNATNSYSVVVIFDEWKKQVI